MSSETAPEGPSTPSTSPSASGSTDSPDPSSAGLGPALEATRQDRQRTTPSPPASRKRAASELSTAHPPQKAPVEGKLGNGGDGGGAAPQSGDALGSLCLCPPEPKIPRPRNAFMLYRQHFQAAVVSSNPGLANPEISKIIGRQWREETAEVKKTWDELAEKEKLRHQQQYPHYKYQPRRKGTKKPSSLSSIDTPFSSSSNVPIGGISGHSYPCGKCGKSSITMPPTPVTPSPYTFGSALPTFPPFTPSTATANASPHPLSSSYPPYSSTPHSAIAPRYLPPVNPPLHYHQIYQNHHNQLHQQQQHQQQQHNNRRHPPPVFPPRYPLIGVSGAPIYPATATPSSPEDMDALTPLTPDAKRRRFSAAYRGALPVPLALVRSSLSSIPDRREALPRADILQASAQGRMHPPPRPELHSGSHAVHADPTLTLAPLQTRGDGSSQQRSVEAMVMTIPFLNKIRVLSRISPRLGPAGPESPVQRVRGCIIAVDGESTADVAGVVRWLEAELTREGTAAGVVKVFDEDEDDDAERAAGSEKSDRDGPTRRGSAGQGREEAEDGGFVRYLKSIRDWHRRGKEMVDFITTPLGNAVESDTGGRRVSVDEGRKDNPALTPIALIPGYMLTRSNMAATSIPINDSYAPVDHWQWAATLWRGIVGPDLTIWIKDCSREEMQRTGGGGVDVRDGERVFVLRKARGVEVEGRVLRRLGFEVGEIVRAVAGRRLN